jgi:excisionase family DNA binding protein
MNLTKLALQDQGTAVQAAEAAIALHAYLRTHPFQPARGRPGDGPEGEKQVLLPADAFELFAAMLAELAAGHTLTVAPARIELTTQQAADLLNVSRPYFIGLLEAGALPYRRVGNRRKVLLSDLLDYQRRDQARRHAILDQLTAEAQAMGL